MRNKLAELSLRTGWRLAFAAIGVFVGGIMAFPPGEIGYFIYDWLVLPLAALAYAAMMIGVVIYNPFPGEKK